MKGSSGVVTSVMAGLGTSKIGAKLLGCFYKIFLCQLEVGSSWDGLDWVGLARIDSGQVGYGRADWDLDGQGRVDSGRSELSIK